MIDDHVDERIRASLADRLGQERPAAELDPVGAVLARVSRRRRRRRGAGALAAVAVVAVVGVATSLTLPGGAAQDVETAHRSSPADRSDAEPRDDYRDGVEEPYEGLDEHSLLVQGEFSSRSSRITVRTESDDQDAVSRYCVGIGAVACETAPDASRFGTVLVDAESPSAYLVVQAPAGIDSVRITWEDGSLAEASVVRPVSEAALGFAAAFIPTGQEHFSYVGVDDAGTPVTDAEEVTMTHWFTANDDLPVRVDSSPILDSLVDVVSENAGALTIRDRYEWQFSDGTRSLFVELEDTSGVLVKVALTNTSNRNPPDDELTKRYTDASPFGQLSVLTFAPPGTDPVGSQSTDSVDGLFSAVDEWVLDR